MGRMTGQRVLITRAADDCAAWASRLADAGAVPLMLPCIECHPIREPNVKARLAKALPNTVWLVLTSRRGAEAIRQMIDAIDWSPTDKEAMAAIRIAVVGPATAAAAVSLPGQVELVAPSGTARSLAEALAARLRARTSGSAYTPGGTSTAGNTSRDRRRPHTRRRTHDRQPTPGQAQVPDRRGGECRQHSGGTPATSRRRLPAAQCLPHGAGCAGDSKTGALRAGCG